MSVAELLSVLVKLRVSESALDLKTKTNIVGKAKKILGQYSCSVIAILNKVSMACTCEF